MDSLLLNETKRAKQQLPKTTNQTETIEFLAPTSTAIPPPPPHTLREREAPKRHRGTKEKNAKPNDWQDSLSIRAAALYKIFSQVHIKMKDKGILL